MNKDSFFFLIKKKEKKKKGKLKEWGKERQEKKSFVIVKNPA